MLTVFISYSHADEGLRDEIEKQLAMLKREGVIEIWHDRRIPAGEDIDSEIDARLQEADIVLLLVSPDFLNSRYCYDVELQVAMDRHHAKQCRVIPVILRPCDWQSPAVPFRGLLAVPTDGKPITRWSDRDEAMLNVVQQLRAAVPTGYKPNQDSRSGAVSGGESPATGVIRHPRSSNLRVAKSFTQVDADRFLDDAFEFMARFFENSLEELGSRNPDIESRFRRIDANAFGCTIYRHGKAVGKCGIRRGSGFGNGITYSRDDSAPKNQMNEELSVESDDQAMWLRPMGMAHRSGRDRDSKFTPDGAAEYFWELLIDPLQQHL